MVKTAKKLGIQTILLPLLFFSSPARATIKFLSFENISAKDPTSTTPIIYAGTGGDGSCDQTAGTTCDSCSQASGDTAGPKACNNAQVYQGLILKITISSDAQTGAAFLKDASSNPITMTAPLASPTAVNQAATVLVDWGNICAKTTSSGGTTSGTVDCKTDGSARITIGIGTDSAYFDVRVQRSICDTVDETGGTGTRTRALSAAVHCSTTNVNGNESIYSFTAASGDQKVYLKNMAAVGGSGGFPTVFNSVNISGIRLYYEDVTDDVAANKGCADFAKKVRNSSKYVSTNISSKDGSTPTPDEDRFRAFTNNHYYVFKLASVDSAGNVGWFTNDVDCSFYLGPSKQDPNPAYVNGDYGYHVAKPDEVIGLLTDQTNCFIATAAYGSSLEPHVQSLRKFRDLILIPNKLGREFVRAYYNYSPSLAKKIAPNESLRAGVRILIWPIWALAEFILLVVGNPGWFTLFVIANLALALALRKKFSNRSLRRFSIWVGFVLLLLPLSKFDRAVARPISPPSTSTEPEAPPQEPPYTSEPEDEPTAIAPPQESKPTEKIVEQKKKTGSGTESSIPAQKKKPKIDPSDLAVDKGLTRITKSGEFIYGTPKTDQSKAASFRIGGFVPPNLTNSKTGLSFRDIYGLSSSTMALFDYEWQFFKSAGILGFKIGSGLFTASGKGRFLNAPTDKAEELYTFVLFPNNAGLIYRMKFYDKQPIVPFIEGGADYYSFLEIRDDGQGTKVGGSAAAHAAGGLAIMMDFLGPKGMTELDNDYSINHVYLVGEYRIVRGLGGKFDFGDDIFSAGITIEF